MKKTDISILLPSLREDLLKRTIEEFAKTNFNVNYEIVVVSPFPIKTDKVVWLKENKRRGSVSATNIAYQFSKGNYKIYFSDDVSPNKDCLKNMLDFMETNKPPFIGAFKMMNTSEEIGPFGAYDKLYACYGCLSKETIQLIGGFFNLSFMYSWADIDLSLRCWEIGGEVKICQNAIVLPRQVNDKIYQDHRNTFQKDFETFTNIWHDKLGKDIPREDGKVNRRLYDNI